MPTQFRSAQEGITRAAAYMLTVAIAIVQPGRAADLPHSMLLAAVMLYFAHNTCSALFGRTVSFPITVRPEDSENYELARVFSAGYSITLWLMLAIAAR